MTTTAITCPQWCTEEHDPTTDPEDVVHQREVGSLEWGAIQLQSWPVAIPGSASHCIYVPGLETDLELEEAAELAAELAFATDQLRKVVNGHDDRVFSETVVEL